MSDRILSRVPNELFEERGHYLGRPADMEDRIIYKRVEWLSQLPDFFGKDMSLLDIGCGNGAVIFKIADRFKSCLGVDITNFHLSAFENFTRLHRISNCECKKMDIEKEKFAVQYDRLISFEVIEHLKSEDSVKAYYDALKPNGLLVISVPNKWWIFETHGANLPLLPWNRVPFFSWLPKFIHNKYAHARIYTKKEISNLLIKHGFQILKIEYITAPMDVIPRGKMREWIIKLFFNSLTTKIPFKSTSIAVLAKRT